MPQIIALGECMVELYAKGPLTKAPTLHRAYGGDTLNVLVAAARLGSTTGYITRVGNDPFTPFLLASWRKEGIDTSQVKVVEGQNGLYIISSGEMGRREFLYYRRGSAATTLFPSDLDEAYLAGAKIIHISGITQAISESARRTALAAAQLAHRLGVAVSYDINFRPRLWSAAQAREAFAEILPYVSICLPSVPGDSGPLLGLEDPEAVADYLRGRGVEIVAAKNGLVGAVVSSPQGMTRVPPWGPPRVVDTTGAGDAFAGGFLHGLVQGLSPVAAAQVGTVTAGLKVGGRGAVANLPRRRAVAAVLQSLPSLTLDEEGGC